MPEGWHFKTSSAVLHFGLLRVHAGVSDRMLPRRIAPSKARAENGPSSFPSRQMKISESPAMSLNYLIVTGRAILSTRNFQEIRDSAALPKIIPS